MIAARVVDLVMSLALIAVGVAGLLGGYDTRAWLPLQLLAGAWLIVSGVFLRPRAHRR